MEWWREKHYDYLVSFDRHDGYQVIKKQPVSWWLPWQRGDILVEEATPAPSNHIHMTRVSMNEITNDNHSVVAL